MHNKQPPRMVHLCLFFFVIWFPLGWKIVFPLHNFRRPVRSYIACRRKGKNAQLSFFREFCFYCILSRFSRVNLTPPISRVSYPCVCAQAGHGAGGLAGNPPPPPGEVTFRSPSASIGLLVMTQLQFLALLSLVPSVHESTSFLASFVENLR